MVIRVRWILLLISCLLVFSGYSYYRGSVSVIREIACYYESVLDENRKDVYDGISENFRHFGFFDEDDLIEKTFIGREGQEVISTSERSFWSGQTKRRITLDDHKMSISICDGLEICDEVVDKPAGTSMSAIMPDQFDHVIVLLSLNPDDTLKGVLYDYDEIRIRFPYFHFPDTPSTKILKDDYVALHEEAERQLDSLKKDWDEPFRRLKYGLPSVKEEKMFEISDHHGRLQRNQIRLNAVRDSLFFFDFNQTEREEATDRAYRLAQNHLHAFEELGAAGKNICSSTACRILCYTIPSYSFELSDGSSDERFLSLRMTDAEILKALQNNIKNSTEAVKMARSYSSPDVCQWSVKKEIFSCLDGFDSTLLPELTYEPQYRRHNRVVFLPIELDPGHYSVDVATPYPGCLPDSAYNFYPMEFNLDQKTGIFPFDPPITDELSCKYLITINSSDKVLSRNITIRHR